MTKIIGTSGPDNLFGGADDDKIFGLGGDDTLTGGGGADSLSGGGGADLLYGGDGFPTDTISDTLLGGGGSDTLYGGAGDVLDGGAGTDHFELHLEMLTAGIKADISALGAGGVASIAGGSLANLEIGSITLTGFKDRLTGIESGLTVDAGAGNDVIKLGDLGGQINGGAGNDKLYGGAAADIIYDIGGGDDYISGGKGSDSITVDDGSDTIYGGQGDDYIAKTSGAVTMFGGAGGDVLHADNSIALLHGGVGDDDLYALAGSTFDGGAGIDTVHLTLTTAVGEAVSLAPLASGGTVVLSDGTMLTSLEVGKIFFGSGDDLVYTGDCQIQLDGGAGDDHFIADGTGSYTLAGGQGSDTIEAGLFNDRLDGGSGVDTVSYQIIAAGVTVSLADHGAQNTGGAGIDNLDGFENLVGTNHDDTLRGDQKDNLISAGDGADTVFGGAGNDTLQGGNDTDTLTYAGASGGVSIDLQVTSAQSTGGAGIDTVAGFENLVGSGFGDLLGGEAGNNDIVGGGGDDTLIGHAGSDTLTGGDGSDTFKFTDISDIALGSPDLIADLTSSDVIDLSGIDADTTEDGNQAFHFVGSFTGNAREATITYDGFNTYLYFDVNGDGSADGSFYIAGDATGFSNYVL